ncbi:MAG: putative protoporphyrinogen oxidase [Chlamydiota bacterium]
MHRKRVIIIGAGISGLAAGWYLKKTHQPLDITYLEKTSRVGGWLQTNHTTGFHFEQGPRAFKVSRSLATIRLLAELELHSEVLSSNAKPHHRYLWHEEELHRFPTHPLAFLFSSLTKGFVKALLSEWRQPCKIGDETVWEFTLRRFNYDVARKLFDPLVVGIFGGDIRRISVKAAFPILKEWEERFGSVTKGFLCTRKERRMCPSYALDMPHLSLDALFSFKAGIEALPQALLTQMQPTIHYDTFAKKLEFSPDGTVRIHTNKQLFEAEAVILACPVKSAGELLEQHFPEMGKELLSVHSQGIAVVNAGYDTRVLPVEGFGYLTATHAHEDVLGVVFDSSVFPEHNRQIEQTRLTIKLDENGRQEDEYIRSALSGIRRHLNISRTPDAICCKKATAAIPQYCTFHLEKMEQFDKQLRLKLPQCYLVGNYISGVSVNDCIARAQHVIATQWAL